jgi:hypothetical protein
MFCPAGEVGIRSAARPIVAVGATELTERKGRSLSLSSEVTEISRWRRDGFVSHAGIGVRPGRLSGVPVALKLNPALAGPFLLLQQEK